MKPIFGQRQEWDQTADAVLERLEPDEPQRYDVDFVDPAPEDGGPTTVYYLHDAGHHLLYVGVSSSALGIARFGQHARDKDWWTEVAYISVEHFATRREALAREALAISGLSPRYNISRPSPLKLGVRYAPCKCGCGREVDLVVEVTHQECRNRKYREKAG